MVIVVKQQFWITVHLQICIFFFSHMRAKKKYKITYEDNWETKEMIIDVIYNLSIKYYNVKKQLCNYLKIIIW